MLDIEKCITHTVILEDTPLTNNNPEIQKVYFMASGKNELLIHGRDYWYKHGAGIEMVEIRLDKISDYTLFAGMIFENFCYFNLTNFSHGEKQKGNKHYFQKMSVMLMASTFHS
jgi:hypothetical protein